ncbi:uncharacterized protein LOC112686179 isoform X2 [Sipha flava]|uniref:Uncharacterized protein LOC112686179 isoform X2 n=1 Tax=Sipha flava TaxID=143950 RepID=A0A8B8FUJ8_9HEMI|nr:uncharacterized protein LOC112686179 isoform X2 [Sipha flava]
MRLLKNGLNKYCGGYFEFSSEKNWGTEQDDCRIFDSIDITHLADSIASVPFNLRHNIPVDLFTVEQLEEFEVESSLALSRHSFQCKSKLSNKIIKSTSTESSCVPETDKLLELIMKNDSRAEEDNNDLNCELQSNEQLCAILGNKKPFINILQDEANTIHNIDISKTDSKTIIDQITSIKLDSEVNITNHDSGHWLDSMLEDSDE